MNKHSKCQQVIFEVEAESVEVDNVVHYISESSVDPTHAEELISKLENYKSATKVLEKQFVGLELEVCHGKMNTIIISDVKIHWKTWKKQGN